MPNLLQCTTSTLPIRATPSDSAEMVTQLLYGEYLEILSTDKKWAHIKCAHDGYEGWCALEYEPQLMHEGDVVKYLGQLSSASSPIGMVPIWPGSLLPTAACRDIHCPVLSLSDFSELKIWEDLSNLYLGSPYLWGGRSPAGIDCSGLTQVMMSFFDVPLSRDASQQVNQGTELPFENAHLGDLAFFKNVKEKVNHVGVVWTDGRILHSSGRVRMDKLTEDGIIRLTDSSLSHRLHSIRRYVNI